MTLSARLCRELRSDHAGETFALAIIVAVEKFVIAHYHAQIVQATGPLRELLVSLQSDEAAHRDDAAARLATNKWWHRLWAGVVQGGSAAAVSLARWV